MTVEAFALPEVFGPSSFSGPWRGCHVDQPTSYYDNGSRGGALAREVTVFFGMEDEGSKSECRQG